MVLTPSNMPDLGLPAPDFSLLEPATDKTRSLADYCGKRGLLVAFISNHCPYVHHIQTELTRLGQELNDSDINMVAIGSNDSVSHPEDGPDAIRDEVANQGYAFPYLFDETQEVAIAYKAACTPDFFLYDDEQRLVYRGQLDASRPGNDLPVDGRDLRAAIKTLRAGDAPLSQQHPSIGCNIKWRVGGEPEWF